MRVSPCNCESTSLGYCLYKCVSLHVWVITCCPYLFALVCVRETPCLPWPVSNKETAHNYSLPCILAQMAHSDPEMASSFKLSSYLCLCVCVHLPPDPQIKHARLLFCWHPLSIWRLRQLQVRWSENKIRHQLSNPVAVMRTVCGKACRLGRARTSSIQWSVTQLSKC